MPASARTIGVKGHRAHADEDTVDGPPPIDVAVLQAGLDSLLEQNPSALVAAIAADGIFVPVPPSVRLTGQGLLPGRSAMDFVVAEDWEIVIAAWEQARATGAARVLVRLTSAPDEPVALHYIDARELHGVYLGVLLGPGVHAALSQGVAVDDLPPRLARAVKNEAAIFTDVDDATVEILGWPADELIGRRSLELIHPDDQEQAIRSWMAMLAGKDAGPRVRLRHRRRDGSWIWLEVTNHNFVDDPDRRCVEAEMIDVSDEVAAHEAIKEREQLFRRLAEALPSGLIQIDRDRRVIYANERLGSVLGVRTADRVDQLLATIVRDDWVALDTAIADALDAGTDTDLEVEVKHPEEASLRRCLTKIRALTNDAHTTEPAGALISIEDITESAQLRTELERRATIDMLTRCLNRATVMAALESTLALEDDAFTAVIFIDLDDFKSVNDRHGHSVGDEVLIVIGERLTRTVRQRDFVGRLGGDEFLVVCPEVSDPSEAAAIRERVADTLCGQFTVAGANLELRASVGVACEQRRMTTAEELVRRADSAMYADKHARPSQPVR